MMPQGFSDDFAEQTFALMAKEIEQNVDDMPSDLMGRMILPMVSEACSHGRTRKIRLQALGLMKVVLKSLAGRDDCAVLAQERSPETDKLSDEELKDVVLQAKESGNMGIGLLLDAIEDKIKAEQKAAMDFESVSVDAILNAPMHPDAAGR